MTHRIDVPDDDVLRLRDSLQAAGYTVGGVRAALGERASAALDRNETTPGLAALDSADSRLSTLIRLWPLQAPVPPNAAAAALPLDSLISAGIVEEADGMVTALVDVRPYADDVGDWWIAADLTPGLDGLRAVVPSDHVLGVNAASSTLAQLTIRKQARRALDLGTGCGVQALHLARHCDLIVATDVNPRALDLAHVTALLNGLQLDLREGDMFEPVSDEQFDLIVTNPPFVVSPGGHHVYRDSGLSGDELSRRVVIDGVDRLAEGGVLQALANWMHVRGDDWRDRVGAWVAATGCDAWVVEREVLDPAEYVELWLRDSGEYGSSEYRARYRDWLRWFDVHHVDGVGFGWINLRKSGRQPVTKFEAWPHAVEQPLGPVIQRWFDQTVGGLDDDELLTIRFVCADDVVQEQVGQPGAEHPDHIVLRQSTGFRRAIDASTAEAGFVGACDGTLTAGALIDALARVLDTDAAGLRHELLPRIRDLAADGYLTNSAIDHRD